MARAMAAMARAMAASGRGRTAAEIIPAAGLPCFRQVHPHGGDDARILTAEGALLLRCRPNLEEESMQNAVVRLALISSLSLLWTVLSPARARAQMGDPAKVTLKTTPVAGSVSM